MVHRVEYVEVDVDSIGVDSDYQRPLNGRNPVQIRDYDVNLIGTPEVVRRRDNTYWCLDGQHRIDRIKREANGNPTSIMCKVHTGITKAEEARLFDGLNDFKTPTLNQKHKARVVAQMPLETFIESEVLRMGWASTVDSHAGESLSVQSARRVVLGSLYAVRKPGEHRGIFTETLGILTKAAGGPQASFANRNGGLSANVFEGLGALLLNNSTVHVDEDVMVTTIQQLGGAQGINLRAKRRRGAEENRLNIPLTMAMILSEAYNARASDGMLEFNL